MKTTCNAEWVHGPGFIDSGQKIFYGVIPSCIDLAQPSIAYASMRTTRDTQRRDELRMFNVALAKEDRQPRCPIGLNYRTNPMPVGFIAKLFPELVCYSRFLWTVFKASARSKNGRYTDEHWCHSSYEVLRTLESVGIRFQMSGLDHIQKLHGPCVVVANHMSVLETVILPILIHHFGEMTFIVKESLMVYPVFKHILRTRNPIVVNRINPREDLKTVMSEGTQRLKNGMSVVVFPQTTRSTSFDPDTFNSLGVKLAARAKVPAVPLALTTDAWGNGNIIKEFGRIDPSKSVRFSFGEPLPIHGRGRDEHQAIIEFIQNKLTQWQRPVAGRSNT